MKKQGNQKNELLEEKERLLREKEELLMQKELQIRTMQASKFWKMRHIYIHYKNGIKEGFKNPFLFFKFVKKRINKYIFKNNKSINNNENKEVVYTKKYYYDIFNFAIIDWDFRFQRPQQLTQEMARNNRVFYVSPNIKALRNENLSYSDIKENITVRNVRDNIFLVTLVSFDSINVYKDVLENKLDRKYLLWSVEAVKEKYNIDLSLSFVELPFWYSVASNLEKSVLIYDCMDHHEGFGDADKKVLELEKKLIKNSKMVVVTSDALKKRVLKMNDNIVVAKNAVELNHFINLPKSNVLKKLKKPIIGYYGAISTWFDFEIIKYCAKKYSSYNFILIGKVCDGLDINELKQMPNVHFLGEKDYKDIPKYLYFFDVCLIPFKIIPLTLATNPVKFFEYIASGKPVVSVNLPELKEYGDICYLSKNKKKFAENIKLALNESDNDIKLKRIEVAKQNTWEKKTSIIMKEIDKKFFPKISIIMVTYNNIHYTKQCVSSVFKYTKYPNYELIIVDNDSKDETPQYLKEIEKQNINVKVILNKENRGFSGGNNDGLKIAKGEYLVLLNNDTIVTENWLFDLKKILDMDKKLGIVGPASNSVGNIQQINVEYEDVADMNIWAKEYTQKQKYEFKNMQMLGFFCVMIKKEAFLKIGNLDENYGVGMFEDDDYCERIREAGYKLGFTKKVFIHHFGSASFKKLEDEKYRKIFNENRKYFEKKWNKKWVPNIDGK